MTLSVEVLRKKAKMLESHGMEKNKINPAHLPELDELLNDIFVSRLPKPIDFDHRRDLVRIFNVMAQEIYGKSNKPPVVEAFGSFIMDMCCPGSDLDLSVNFSNKGVEVPREKRIGTLQKFTKKLKSLQRGGHIAGLQTIMSARVPVVKVIDCGTGIECDLSVENRHGIAKSQIVHMISGIDGRFRKLSFLMKAWAKAYDINSPKDRTLSSLSLISLVAFHLQPPWHAPDGTDPASVSRTVHNYLDYGEKNKESVSELFVTLLVKLESVEKLWEEGLCASLYEGSWTSKSWDCRNTSISVEDFTDRSQNVARAVGVEKVKKIYECVHHCLGHLLAFLDGQMQGPKLRELLVGVDTISPPQYIRTRNLVSDENAATLPVPNNPHPTKKRRLMEGSEGQQFVEGWGRKKQPDAWGGIQHSNGWELAQQAKHKTFCNGTSHSQCTPQVPNQITPFVSGFNKSMCCSPWSLPFAPPQNPTYIEGSHGHLPYQPIISPQISRGFGASHSQNPIFPVHNLGAVHAPHAELPRINTQGEMNALSLQNWSMSCVLPGRYFP